MKIETKISANGNVNIYVDGKRTSNTKAFEIAWDNNLPTYSASCLTYAGNFISESFASPISAYRWLLTKANTNNNFADGSWEIQQVDKINGRRTTIYESMERAFACNNAELEAYILTLDNNDAEKIKAIIAKAAKYVKEESYKLTPEYAREQEERAAKAKAEAEKKAIWEATKYLAAKIAADSKSVNDNFRMCIYCFEGESVQSSLAESREDDNTDVFDLLPTVDELNDVDTDETDEVTEEAAAPIDFSDMADMFTPEIQDEPITFTLEPITVYETEPPDYSGLDEDLEAETDEVTDVTDELNEIFNEIMDTNDKLDVKIVDGAPQTEIQTIAEQIVALQRRYCKLYKIKYGADSNCQPKTADEIIADAIELLTVIDSDGNEVKPPAAKMFTETAEVDDTEHFIQADNEPEVKLTDDQRKIAEQVCDSMTAAAPDDTWSVTFTDNGKFAVYSSDSVNVVDTITAGDFLNPKEFFEQFRRKPTQAELDDEREAALAELRYEREQLLKLRDAIIDECPDEVNRLKLLDEMLADNDAELTALESLCTRPGMFNGNPKKFLF